MKYQIFRFAVIATFVLFVGCNEDDDVCSECNDAIEHIYGKLDENACNPDFMENAYQRIMEHCGVVTANYVTGYMAHTCQYVRNDFKALKCNDMDGEQSFGTAYIDNVDIRVSLLSNSGDIEDTQLEVRLEKVEEGGGDGPPTALLEVNESALFTFNDVDNGRKFSFSLVRVIADDELVHIEEFEELYFYRPSNWNITREIAIVWDPFENKYIANFNYW